MDITTQIKNGTYDVMLRGRFTFSDHSEFRNIIANISAMEIQQIVLHMPDVEFVDSAALGMLLLAFDEATKYHKKIAIRGATGQVKKMLSMARLSTLFAS